MPFLLSQAQHFEFGKSFAFSIRDRFSLHCDTFLQLLNLGAQTLVDRRAFLGLFLGFVFQRLQLCDHSLFLSGTELRRRFNFLARFRRPAASLFQIFAFFSGARAELPLPGSCIPRRLKASFFFDLDQFSRFAQLTHLLFRLLVGCFHFRTLPCQFLGGDQ